MHKRARNHVLKAMWRKDTQECLEILIWYPGYKDMEKYEPQGKREARKYVKGLLYYKPSNFNELHFKNISMVQTENGVKYEIIYKDDQRYVHYFRNGFEVLEKANKPTEWIKA